VRVLACGAGSVLQLPRGSFQDYFLHLLQICRLKTGEAVEGEGGAMTPKGSRSVSSASSVAVHGSRA
jgi:hypothetical protein